MHTRAVSFPLCSCLLSAVGRLWGLSGYQRCLSGCVQTFCCDKYPNTPNWGKPHFEHGGISGTFSRTSLCWLLPRWIQIQEITVIKRQRKVFTTSLRPPAPSFWMPPMPMGFGNSMLLVWTGLDGNSGDPHVGGWSLMSQSVQRDSTPPPQPWLPHLWMPKHTSAATWSHQAYFKGTESSIFRHPDAVICFRCEHAAGCCVYAFSEGPCGTEVTIPYPF